MVASAPGRQRAQPAQLQAVQQDGFFRTLRFEEYVGGSPGRAFPEESPKVQSCSGAQKNKGNLKLLSFAVYVRELNAR